MTQIVRFEPRKANPANVKPVLWLWRQRIPLGNLALLIGEEGIGKGALQTWLAARITRGELPGDYFGKPANVLIIGDEDGFDDVWTPRLIAAGADLNRVYDLPPSDVAGLLDVHRDREELRRIVRELQTPIVFLDQLLDNLPNWVDDLKPRSVRAGVRPLGRLAREEGFAVLASLHVNKSGDTFRQKMAGSHVYNALARAGMLLSKHPSDTDKRVLASGKGNLAKRPPSLEFTFTGRLVEANGHQLDVPAVTAMVETALTVEDLLAPPDEADALTVACEFLAVELKTGPRPVPDLKTAAEQAGVAWRTAERAKQRLGIRSKKGTDSWLWEIPPTITVKTTTKTAMPVEGGVDGLGGLDPTINTANTAKAANSTHGGLDGGLERRNGHAHLELAA